MVINKNIDILIKSNWSVRAKSGFNNEETRLGTIHEISTDIIIKQVDWGEFGNSSDRLWIKFIIPLGNYTMQVQ